MHIRPVYQWSARVKDAVIMRLSSYALPRRVTHVSDCTALVCRSWPPAWPRCAAAGLLKTRNQFIYKVFAKWADDGSLWQAFVASVAHLAAELQLDLSVLHGDGTNTVAKKGGMVLATRATSTRKGRRSSP
jgi:hypothetical protein